MTSRLKPEPEQDYSVLPCPSHLAFAFAIVRSKPPQISIEHYVDGLRSAVVTTPGHYPLGILSFDADMYWKASYQKAESERVRLTNELDQVRRERDSIRSHQDSQHSRGQGTLGKRRRDSSVQRTGKKNKNQTDSDHDNDDIDLELANVTTFTTDRQAFLRGFVHLRRNLYLAEPDQETLANAINATCDSISNILLQATQITGRPHAELDGQSIRQLCTAFRRVYPSVIKALECIQPQIGEDGDQYIPTLSTVVKTFQAFLGRLHKFALDEFARREQEAKRNGRASGRRAKGMTNAEHTPINEDDLAKVRGIIQTMARMITMLDVTKDAQCELLEGYLCTILDHVGSSLSLLAFTDTGVSAQKQTGLLPPTGLLDIGQLNIDTATGTAAIEGPYVLFVLRQGIEFLLANAKRMSKKSLSNFTVQPEGTYDTVGDKDLRRRIEETLQNTLLRGAFGDEDDTFYNSLRREEGEEPDLQQIMGEIKQKESSAESFICELWDYLGWDILSGRKGA